MKNNISGMFDAYVGMIDNEIQSKLHQFGQKNSAIRSPVEYALMSGGKRIRPMLVCMFAKGLNKNRPVLDSAVAVEYIHTSTLIADDLPCMDNDDERRGVPTVHKAFNEASALLASYALISGAYSCIYSNAKTLKSLGYSSQEVDVAYDYILLSIDKNFGAEGILGGQFEDMFCKPEQKIDAELIIKKKTGSLFEISSISGWLFGGGNPEAIGFIKEFSTSFGMLFQIQDDLCDLHKDQAKSGLNYALLFGEQYAKNVVDKMYMRCIDVLNHLHKQENLQDISELKALIDYVRYRSS